MMTIDIRYAKTHLSKLVEQAAKGEPFMITKAGKPMVKVVRIDNPEPSQQKKVGAIEGMFEVPEDIDTMFRAEIDTMFYSGK